MNVRARKHFCEAPIVSLEDAIKVVQDHHKLGQAGREIAHNPIAYNGYPVAAIEVRAAVRLPCGLMQKIGLAVSVTQGRLPRRPSLSQAFGFVLGNLNLTRAVNIE